MAGSAPIREPIIDLRTGKLSPVWERYFTLTLQSQVDEIPEGGVDFSAIVFGDGDGKKDINTLEKLLYSIFQPQNLDLVQRIETLEKIIYNQPQDTNLIQRLKTWKN